VTLDTQGTGRRQSRETSDIGHTRYRTKTKQKTQHRKLFLKR
jgi:hypothetical protein